MSLNFWQTCCSCAISLDHSSLCYKYEASVIYPSECSWTIYIFVRCGLSACGRSVPWKGKTSGMKDIPNKSKIFQHIYRWLTPPLGCVAPASPVPPPPQEAGRVRAIPAWPPQPFVKSGPTFSWAAAVLEPAQTGRAGAISTAGKG